MRQKKDHRYCKTVPHKTWLKKPLETSKTCWGTAGICRSLLSRAKEGLLFKGP